MAENLGSRLVATSPPGDEFNLAIRLYSFNIEDYNYLEKRSYDKNAYKFVDDTDMELITVLNDLVKIMPSNDTLYQSSGGRETRAVFKRALGLFFPWQKNSRFPLSKESNRRNGRHFRLSD